MVFDPWSVELDGSDATFGFVLSPMSHAEFKRKYGKKREAVSFGDKDQRIVDGEREDVMVAEQWWCEDTTQTMVICGFPDGSEGALTEADLELAVQNGQILQPLSTYKDKKRQVWWRRMSGIEVLEQATDREGNPAPYPADGIGIVPVYGYVGWESGRMTYCGIPRRARDSQRAYNYHVSEIRALMATAPKAPWIGSKRAFAGLETLWDRASVETRAFLPYNDLDEMGAIAPPQRAPVAVNLANHQQAADQALRDIQASIGMYQANLGAPSNESSGVAIDARKAQGEASTAHFPAHLAASVSQVGSLCLQMIPRLLDTKRQLRILGIDQTPSHIRIDPKQAEAEMQTEQGISINPCVGRYEARVVTGSSFTTQRQQAQAAYTEMMRANPGMMPAIAPLWAQSLDVPHADKLAQVLTAMAPEPVKAILNPDEQETAATLRAKLDQLQQALNEALQHAHDAQQDADEAQSAIQAKHAEDERAEREMNIKAYQAETDRLKVVGANEEQIQAIVVPLVQSMIAQPAPLDEPPEFTEAPEAEEPMEPEGPPEYAQQLMQGHQDMAGAIAELMQGHQAMHGSLEQIARLIQAPRKRIPVRDSEGNITQVIDQLDHGATLQ